MTTNGGGRVHPAAMQAVEGSVLRVRFPDRTWLADYRRDTMQEATETDDSDETSPTAHSKGDRIIAKANGSVIEGDWQTMKRLAKDILNEAEAHKTDLQKADEIFDADIRISCDCCDYEEDFDSARQVRDRRATPEEHADHPDFDCEPGDVSVEAVCPRHGTIPLSYDRCDSCADAQAVMNR